MGSQFFWGQQYHGMAGSSLRQGQVGPIQDGHRDNRTLKNLVPKAAFFCHSVSEFFGLPGGVIGNT